MKAPRLRAFSLLEMLVSMVVVVMVLIVVLGITNESSGIWRRSMQKKDAFSESRTAFEDMVRTLSQATLNIYWGYRMGAQGNPTEYGRESELHFICGPSSRLVGDDTADCSAVFFQAPLGGVDAPALGALDGVLNATGYFVEYGVVPETEDLPDWLTGLKPEASRLIRWQQPAEELFLYSLTSGAPNANSTDWIQTESDESYLSVAADHVLALYVVARYLDADGELVATFDYDSRNPDDPAMHNQLPLSLEVSLLVTDSVSSARLEEALALPDVWDDPAEDLEETLREFAEDLALSSDKRPALNCRILSAHIPLVGSRWSGQ